MVGAEIYGRGPDQSPDPHPPGLCPHPPAGGAHGHRSHNGARHRQREVAQTRVDVSGDVKQRYVFVFEDSPVLSND
jgi:hypothetical protein